MMVSVTTMNNSRVIKLVEVLGKTGLHLLLWLAVATSTQADCDFDDFPVMPGMRTNAVMEDASYNNRPMSIRGFNVDAGIKQVVAHYHRVWRKQYDDTVFGPWYQVTTLNNDCMMTVQVASDDDSSSYGRLIISNPPKGNPRASLGADILAPSDAVVVTDLLTDDGPKRGRVSVLASADSVDEVTQFYLTEMQQRGWGLDRQFSHSGNRVLVFRKGLKENNVLLAPTDDGMTQILINRVDVN